MCLTSTSDLVHAGTRSVAAGDDAVPRALLIATTTFALLQICRFCYSHIKDELNNRCPACRQPYDDSTVDFKPIKPEECVFPHARLRACCANNVDLV